MNVKLTREQFDLVLMILKKVSYPYEQTAPLIAAFLKSLDLHGDD